MNTPELISQVIEHGAVKLPGIVDAHELDRIDSRGHFQYETLPRIAPALGSFIKNFVDHLPENTDVRLSRELLASSHQDQQYVMHVDSLYNRGFSFLIPLNGPIADFYYAEEKLYIPSQLQAARHFTYGPGDIAVIRQKIKVGDDLPDNRVSQIWHAGIADGERELVMCDMLFDSPISTDPLNTVQVAA